MMLARRVAPIAPVLLLAAACGGRAGGGPALSDDALSQRLADYYQKSVSTPGVTFKVVKLEYSELFAFPMSGGYVGPVLIPSRPRWVGSAILALDEALMGLARLLGLGRLVGWRYLLVADLPG